MEPPAIPICGRGAQRWCDIYGCVVGLWLRETVVEHFTGQVRQWGARKQGFATSNSPWGVVHGVCLHFLQQCPDVVTVKGWSTLLPWPVVLTGQRGLTGIPFWCAPDARARQHCCAQGPPVAGHRAQHATQHSPNTPTTGLRERGNDTSKSTGRSGQQKAATRRNMRREGRVTV